MKSRFSYRGHPFHPMLVVLPIGLIVWTFFADLVYLFGGRNMTWYDIAFYTGIAAVVTALVAALPGLGDYFTLKMSGRARATATLHMLLNFFIVALFIVAALLMAGEGATGGVNLAAVILLHAAGAGLVAVSGWLGGDLVYHHHLAVVPAEETPGQQPEREREPAGVRGGSDGRR